MTIRPRTPTDVPGLVEVMGSQQAATRYPVRWPPPFPPEDFIVRSGEIGAWVAQVDGRLAGHISARRVPVIPEDTSAGDEAGIWTAGTGLPVDRLGSISALFLATWATGLGLGGALHDVAVAALRAAGLTPVLDVTQNNAPALALYRSRGWQEVGSGRPHWLPADWDDVLYFVLPPPVDAPVG